MILRKRWNLIPVGFFGNACDLLCCSGNSKSNVIFMRNLLRVFFPPIIIDSNRGT